MLMAGMFYLRLALRLMLTPNSYVEGIVRGYRNTLLTGQNYGNLTQCETIDGNFLRAYFCGCNSLPKAV